MGYYYAVRGWLELDEDSFGKTTAFLKENQKSIPEESKLSLYAKGWCWNEQPINWTRYVFYGADITEEGLDHFKETLKKISQLDPEIFGYFHAQGEDHAKVYAYTVRNGAVQTEENKPAFL